MLEIPITAGEFEHPTGRTLVRLGALMLWPEDRRKWRKREQQLFGRAGKRVLGQLTPDQQVTVGGYRQLQKLAITARSIAKIDEEDAPRHRQGALVGAIVLDALERYRRVPGRASIQEAKSRWAAWEGISVARVDKSDWWPRFKPVAHLWAAHLLFARRGHSFPCQAPNLPDMLSAAQVILIECGAAHARQSRQTYLDVAECWRMSPSIVLRNGQVKIERE